MRGTIPTSRHGEGGSGGYQPLLQISKIFQKKKIRNLLSIV
nr:MAG TPA: hypothetical protein [Crassvirales sp.]